MQDVSSLPGVAHAHCCIGEGSFSKVYYASMDGLSEVAIKVFQFDQAPSVDMRDLLRLSHPNLVRVLRVIDSPSCAVALDLCYCTLHAALHGNLNHPIQAFELIQPRFHCALDIVRALCFLHSREIVHDDVSAPNCFLSRCPKPGSEELPTVKLGDFVGPRFCQLSKITRWAVTPIYMAPEVAKAEAASFRSISADIYAFGILLHEIVSRLKPFSHRATSRAVLFVLQGERPSLHDVPSPPHVKDIARDRLLSLIQQCWHQEAIERPHAIEVCWRLASVATSWTLGFQDDSIAAEEEAVPPWFVAYVCKGPGVVRNKIEADSKSNVSCRSMHTAAVHGSRMPVAPDNDHT